MSTTSGAAPSAFWSIPAPDLLKQLGVADSGLSSAQAAQRLAQYGPNTLKAQRKASDLGLLLGQFKSPIIILLLCAAGLSIYVQSYPDAVIIFVIVLISGLLGFWQERGAAHAVEKLLAIVQTKASVLRDGQVQALATEGIVPGDIMQLTAGATIPGDCLILQSRDLNVDEAALTGETYPAEKSVGVVAADAPLSQRRNSLFMGTHVVSGSATALVVRTGRGTEFGQVSQQLQLRPAETDFERGVRRFGYLLMEVTLVLVIAIFGVNAFLGKPILDSFMFSLALAVGLTPQLLPAIISVNLCHGARRMAQSKVIVKRMSSIENFGSMDVLCSDKTGTLTDGTVKLRSAADVAGNDSERVFLYAYLNAKFETGFSNPLDDAVCSHAQPDISAWRKLDEVPYDFQRKRLSVLADPGGGQPHLLLVKGALQKVLECCTAADGPDGAPVDLASVQDSIQQRFAEYGAQGFRTLGVAYKDCGAGTHITQADEAGLTFAGFLVLFDPPKASSAATVQRLRDMGVTLKMITGDNPLVAAYVGQQVGLANPSVLSGQDLAGMTNEALVQRVNTVDIFAEVDPSQKERLIVMLRKAGHVVGYMGDGINDASALHAADVGISVASAVDVAKEAAQIVLLEQDLAVLAQGVEEGRATFANTLKYVCMATSANFGNMFSMAGASLFLKFLPLLPRQVLLMNLITDGPEMTIATDHVDPELVAQPRRWNIAFIRNFMVLFGLVSSVFDYLTFGVLLFMLHAAPAQFRTGWFVESIVSAALIVLVVRTRRPFFRSAPGRPLLIGTLLTVAVTLALPYTPLGALFGFTPLPLGFLGVMGLIVVLYMATAEAAKHWFYRRVAA
jgi:Mg2+-importing ATPase